jgi:lipopolysaccharide/colanic/teichoic acid biosynthesis glycosyltransferase
MVSLKRQPRAADIVGEAHEVDSPLPTNGHGQVPSATHQYEGIPPGVVAGGTSPWKRAIDVAACGTAVAILWPVFATAALLIKLDSHGPVLVRQRRVGLMGREFDFFKFRTMYHHKTKQDLGDRLPTGDLRTRLLSPKGRPTHATTIGWTLRQTTIDELPQLLNVIRGDMSIVGPRPDIPEIVNHWPEEFRQRHLVRPGMTGLAQVNGRSDITHYQKVKYDIAYVRKHPISRDLGILWKTLSLVASKKGAR